jgi:hypothetical protein
VVLGLAAYIPGAAFLVVAFGVGHVFYGFFDVSDIPLYHSYAAKMDMGLRPFADFTAEYPPLALRLFAYPGHPAGVEAYEFWFALLMMALLGAAAVAVTVTASRIWSRSRVTAAVGATFSASVVALGAVVANRFDAVVALSLAVFLWALSSRRWLLGGLALGLGTAVKLAPVVLLPLGVLVPLDHRARMRCVAGFGLAAVPPFLLGGGAGWGSLGAIVSYHGARPLQVESVLATPLLLAHVAGGATARIVNAFGSQCVDAAGAPLLAGSSGILATVFVSAVYGLAWRGREHLRRRPADAVLVAIGVLLAFLVPAKVLSPQFLIWLLPALALVAPTAPGVAALLVGGLLLTQVEFPAMYWDFVALRPSAVLVVAVRNAVLVTSFVWTLVLLRRLAQRDAARGGERGSSSR